MTANTSPRFLLVPKNGFCKITAADTTADGTDADVQLLFTANATDGSKVESVVFYPSSTSGAPTTSATCLRVYLNNGSTVATASNNVIISEKSAAAQNVSTTATVAAIPIICHLGIQLQAGYRLYVSSSAVAANTQWQVSVEAGDFS